MHYVDRFNFLDRKKRWKAGHKSYPNNQGEILWIKCDHRFPKDIFVTKDLQEKLSVSLYVCLFVSFKTFAILNTAFFERIFKFISQMLIAHYQNCEQRMPHFDNKYVKKSKMLKIWQILSYIRTMLHTYRMFHKKILQQLQ